MDRRHSILVHLVLPVLFGAAAAGEDLPADGAAATAIPEAATEPSPRPPPVRELAPELYYLRDDAGRLVPVPGFRYGDFLELFRIKEGLAGPLAPPAAILENVVVRIDCRGLKAGGQFCPVEATARVRQSRGGWAMVSLALGQLLLDGPPRHQGDGRMLVDADPEGGGYRCWFEAPPGKGGDLEHTVTFTGRMPVEAGDSRESFVLRLPAAVATRLEIRSDRTGPSVEVLPATDRVTTTADGRGSLVTVSGMAGEVRVRLQGTDAATTAATVAEADCRSTVRIDGRSATIAATLAVANLPTGTRRLLIGLPPRAELRRVGGDASPAAKQEAGSPGVVAVAVEPRADGSATIVIECERPMDPSGSTALDPLGFDVRGIEPWRQRGRAILIVEGDWQATWDDLPGIRRVDPPAGERQPGFVAAFAYDAQPASLPLQIRPRRSRVVIEPEYRYDVSAARVALEGRLRVAVRGAPVGGVSIALDPAWSLGDVGPAGLVDLAGVRSDDGRITIPFLQPLTGDAVVELEAARAIEPAADRIAWRLPAPRADLVGPATVIVASDSAIELLPDAAGTTGLVRQTSTALRTDAPDTRAVVYRLDAPEGTFAATRRFLPRRVEAVVSARLSVDEQEIDVVESIRLDVGHVPLEFLELSVARELVDGGTLEIRQAGESLDVVGTEAEAGTDAADRPLTLVRVLLPQPLLGKGEVTVRYRMAAPAIPAEATVAVDLPLPLPTAGGGIRQSVTIAESSALAVVPRGDAWRREVSAQGGAPSWSASKPRNVLPLAISARSRESAGVTVIEASWLRTRLFPDTREDTATYVVSPTGPQLDLRLPAAETTEVRLDGSPAILQARGDGLFTIDVSQPAAGSRLLEIRTTSPWGGTVAGLGLPWPLRLDPPEFAGDVIERRFSWELATLPGDHLLWTPLRWTGQQRWQWRGVGWDREPVVSTEELGDWIARTLGRPVSAIARGRWPARERRVVFAGIGAPGSATAWVVPTWCIVLVSSGVSLALGLAVAAGPARRRPAVMVGLLAAGTVIAAVVPDMALLVGQAAVPGAMLALLAAALGRVGGATPQRAGRPAPAPASASSLTRSAVPPVSLIVASSLEAEPRTAAGRGTT